MGRRKTVKIRIEPQLVQRTASGVLLTEDILSSYMGQLREQNRCRESLRSCEKILDQFYTFLPADKAVNRDTLSHWREQLLSAGYAIRTVNSKVSTVNALLEAIDCRNLQVDSQLLPDEFTAPELTRQEYIRMLQAAKAADDRRGYLLTKLFATTGLSVSDLPLVTADTVKTGALPNAAVRFPGRIRQDLMRYAADEGRLTGPLFTQKDGSPLSRTQVSLYIQKLGQAARVPTEKANIRALRQLHKGAIAAIEANFDLLVQQAYGDQLEKEELTARWE